MIIVVGGGIAGLSLAWQLVKAGAPVTVLEQAGIGSGASRAAAAYLEPRLGRSAMRDIEWAAVKAWPEYAGELEDVTGLDLDYRRDGQLRIAYKDNLDKVKADMMRRCEEGWRAHWLEGAELQKLEPHLSSAVVAGCYLPDVSWLDGRKLCAALAAAITGRGAIVREDTKVQSVSVTRGRVAGVHTSTGYIPCDKIVLSSAMGTNDVLDLPRDVPRCRPVKGVILSLGMDKNAPIINRLIKRPDGILCPRSDGRVLIGSTHEEGETSLTASDQAIASLMESAVRAVPELAELPLLQATCGIRSFIGDGLLRLGKSTEADGLYYSLSHAGAGFIRAPVIAAELASFILSNKASVPLIDKFLKR